MSPRYVGTKGYSVGFKLASVNPTELANAIIHSYTELERTIQVEQTKRLQIIAATQIRSQEHRDQIELFREYLRLTFDERRRTFDKLISQADIAIEKGDNVALATVMESTKALIEQSPFKALADMETVRQGFKEKKEWDLS